jgi:hypothetical protein
VAVEGWPPPASMPAVTRRVLLVAIVLLAAVACGGPENGGTTDPKQYAKSVCSGLLAWRQGVTSDSTKLSGALQSGASDVATVRKRYTDFYAGTTRRTDDLLRVVSAAGAPKVDNGLGYARDLSAALGQARKGLADARTRFAKLPASDLKSYAAGAAKVRDSLGTVFTDAGASLDRLGTSYTDSDLVQAFRDEPDCQRLS